MPCRFDEAFVFALLLTRRTLSHLIRAKRPSQTGTKWHLVCRAAVAQLSVISEPGLPCGPLPQTRPPAARIMRNSGIRSGSLCYLHSLREWSLENFSLTHTHAHPQTPPIQSLAFIGTPLWLGSGSVVLTPVKDTFSITL